MTNIYHHDISPNMQYLASDVRKTRFFYIVETDQIYFHNSHYHGENEVELFDYQRVFHRIPGNREVYYLPHYFRSDIIALHLRLKYFGIENYRIFSFRTPSGIFTNSKNEFSHLELLDESDAAVFKLHFHEKITESSIKNADIWFSGAMIKENKFRKPRKLKKI